jgi:flagellar hook-associated protein 1 FlgK
MPSLTSSLWIAAGALQATQGALDVTANNISNANTPGYSRQRAILSEQSPTQEGNLQLGNGVNLTEIRSIRDQILQLRITQEMQQQSSSETQYNALQQVQMLYSSTTSGIGADFTAFFNKLNQLATDPTNTADRQAVLSAAQNLAGDFNQSELKLNTISSGLDQTVSQTVTQINSLTQQIAKVNAQVGSLQRDGKDPGVLLDQENQLINQLSQLTDISQIQTEQGLTITTGNGTPLVVGGESFALQASPDSTGKVQIISGGQNITASINGGKLGGTIQVRDVVIPNMLTQLDDLASQFASSINAAHTSGFDLNGDQGAALFNVSSGSGAASTLSVAISDPRLIAASSDGTTGSNGNIANLLAVQTQALPGGQTPGNTYASMVSQIGNLTAQALADASSGNSSLTQLNDQLGAISGVSIDEETTNLINYQRTYEAAARVVTTIDVLTQTVLQMGASA